MELEKDVRRNNAILDCASFKLALKKVSQMQVMVLVYELLREELKIAYDIYTINCVKYHKKTKS